MSDAFLTTKLYAPPTRTQLVPRPQLTGRLNNSLQGKLTLVSAPAGFGKTTLVSEWLQARERPFTWLSLDAGDNDPVRFLTYIVAALQKIESALGQDIPGMLQATQPPPLESLITALINEIAATPIPFILVLDDYHAITTPPVHDTLTFLLDNMPPQMHLVVITRADPPLPLSRLRVRRELTEIRDADLRFTLEETAVFLNDVMGLNLTPEQIAALEARTEGWVAGLQLAALSLQRVQHSDDIANFIQTFTGSHRYIMDYLVEEVFTRQSSHVQDFLLQTAILDRLSAPLCDTITGHANSQEMLEMLDQANLFMVPLDHNRGWYRYHHLFADLLRGRLQQMQPELVPVLHRRASGWYERNGMIAEAIHHTLAAGDYDTAARLVEETGVLLLRRGEVATLLNWLEALPDESVRCRPRLCLDHAWVLLITGQWDAVEPRLQDIERTLSQACPELVLSEACPESRRRVEGRAVSASADHSTEALDPELAGVLGEVAAVRAYVAFIGRDASRAIELCRQAFDLLPEADLSPPGDLSTRSVVAWVLGNAYLMSDDVVKAGQALTEAITFGRASGNVHIAALATCWLAKLHTAQGQLHRAAEIYQEALQMEADAHVGMADLLCEWNNLEAAADHALESIKLSQQWMKKEPLVHGYVVLARVLQAQGDIDGALDTLQKARRLAQDNTFSSPEVAQVEAGQVRLWLAQGDLAAASRWIQESRLSLDDEPDYLHEVKYIMLARVLIAQGRETLAGRPSVEQARESPLQKALDLLARLLEAAEATGRMGSAIEILVLQALAHQAQGDIPRALVPLERALTLAEPEGYIRVFVDKGEPMRILLRHVAARGIMPEYVTRLLGSLQNDATRHRGIIEPLTPREVEVLRLIAAGLRNQEIADQLFISVATVKRHVTNIYGKLGVGHRTQAAARAQELDLLQKPP